VKAIVRKDARNEIDRKYDDLWNKLCRDGGFTLRQRTLISYYLREIMATRIKEIEGATDMSWIIALVESEKYGTDVSRGATRLPRVQQKAVDVRNEAYSHSCYDANGVFQKYDSCGVEHLQSRLAKYNIRYDIK
jgi:hypothetical protein